MILLAVLAAISFATGDARAGTVMVAMVALSVGLRFWQEAIADSAAAQLKAMIHVTATVVRDGQAAEMPLRDLVPGDFIQLAAGDMIPGDVRILASKDFFVSQGSLLGFSDPRQQPGELLWPARFGADELVSLKRSLGSYAASGQLQQRPSPAEGGMLKRNWFRFFQRAGQNLPPIDVRYPDGSHRLTSVSAL
ncbi:MAG: hypothetical protein ABI824_19110 [Acidobacteriota bacterium]